MANGWADKQQMGVGLEAAAATERSRDLAGMEMTGTVEMLVLLQMAGAVEIMAAMQQAGRDGGRGADGGRERERE